MRYYTVYDILVDKVKLTDETSILKLFKKEFGMNKSQVQTLKESTYVPKDRSILNPILEFLNITELEMHLMLGIIPSSYQNTYLTKIKEIAALLNDPDENVVTEYKIRNRDPYFSTPYGSLYKGDVMDMFQIIPDESVDLIFADPPFNLNKEYDDGITDKKSVSEYISWCTMWLDQCIRVLKPNGSLFIYNLPKWNVYFANHLNHSLRFFNMISIDMKYTLPISNRLYPSHYSLLYFVKGEKPRVFNNQRIPLQTCRHCGGEIKDYGGYKKKMNPLGVNLSDVWTDIYPVRHTNSKKRNFNELPVKLLDRIITMSSNEGDIVLDPFGGSGTTFAVAELLKRNWVGFELGNCEIIKERLLNKKNDELLLSRVYEEKNTLFPLKAKKLRKLNGFWLENDC